MRRLIVTLVLISTLVLTACGGNTSGSGGKQVTIGYFPNLTHIVPIVALEKGYFEEAFGDDVKIETKTFTQGGLFMEAMASNAVDIGTTGPCPILNFYSKDPKYHILSGSVNGGAVLVTSKDAKVNDLKDLAGKRVAIPGVGNTQDIMLRKALKDVGLKTTTSGGDVELHPTAPVDTRTLFRQKSIDAAAVPEPWGYTLETKEQGQVLLDWTQFAWGKDSPMTVVGASEKYMESNEAGVKAYLKAHTKAVEFIQDNPEEAKKLVIQHLKGLTGQELDAKEVDVAFDRLEVTTSLNEDVVKEMAEISHEADYITHSDIKGLVDLQYIK